MKWPFAMLTLLSPIFITTTVLAQTVFNSTFQNTIIDDFSIVNDRIYITTPKTTYLLNSTFSIIEEFAKNFTNSMMFYANSDILLECGENATLSDACCYLRNPQTLATLATINDNDLCYNFRRFRFFYLCSSPKADGHGTNFYMLISYYKEVNHHDGAFTRIWFGNISNNQLTYLIMPMDFYGVGRFRPQVISPTFTHFKKFVVMSKSSHYKEAYYIDPNLTASTFTVPMLTCDDSNKDVILGFGIAGTSQSKVKNIIPTSDDLAHFLLFKSHSYPVESYRICSYTEKEMATERNLFKNSLFTSANDSGIIDSFIGRLVNNEIVVLYSIDKSVYKVRLDKDDRIYGIMSSYITNKCELEVTYSYITNKSEVT